MQETILIKLGELVLKGLNRKVFEAQLLKNIRRRLMGLGEFEVKSAQSTIYVIPKNEEADLDAAEEKVGKVFGIVSYSRACVAEKDMAAIQQAAADYLRDELMEASTFKVESKRSDKKFAYTSPEISREVGAYLLEKPSGVVTGITDAQAAMAQQTSGEDFSGDWGERNDDLIDSGSAQQASGEDFSGDWGERNDDLIENGAALNASGDDVVGDGSTGSGDCECPPQSQQASGEPEYTDLPMDAQGYPVE